MRSRRVFAELLEPRRLLAANLVISEFLASNNNSITDSFGNHEDWIEIHNAGDATANLHDYFLTDNAGNPEQWRFPVQDLSAGAFLVVFASGRDLATAGSELHTNFKLGADGEYLGLIRAADDTPQFEYAPTFPPQSADISYGLYNADDPNSAQIYFSSPTPGAINNPTAAAATYSVQGKTFAGTLNVSLSSSTPGAVIHYTIDGTVPTTSSSVYSGTLALTNTTMLRTIVAAPGYGLSPVTSQSYIALNSTISTMNTLGSSSVAAFTSNLPIVMINTFTSASSISDNATISQTSDTGAIVDFINTSGGIASAVGTPDYDGRAGIHVRGSTSSGYPKKQFSIELWDENNDDKKVSLLGMPSESDWVLYAPYTEKAMMQNALAYKLANEMGHYASRTQYVELFLNTQNSGSVASGSAPGGIAPPNTGATYAGVYILEEKIKTGSNRVDVDRISPSNPNGGWIVAQDRTDSGTEAFFSDDTKDASGNSTPVKIIYDDPDVHSITAEEKSTIKNGWNAFVDALFSSSAVPGQRWNDASPDNPNYYGNYIDIRSFADFYLLNEMMRNIDSFWLSTYFNKAADTVVNGVVTQRGLISAGPVWDFNLALGAANYNSSANSDGWDTDTLSPAPGAAGVSGFNPQDPYFQKMLADPGFKLAVADRWENLRSTIFATPQLMSDIDAKVSLLANGTTNYPVGPVPAQPATNPIVRNFIRWPELGVYVTTEGFYDPNGNWINEINLAKNWLTARVNWLDSQFIPRPTVTPGGSYASPVSVTMSPVGASTTTDTTLLAEGAPVRWVVPSAGTPATGWYLSNYTYPTSPTTAVWASGNGGVGYDTQTSPVNFLPFIGSGSNSQSKSFNLNPTIYTRWTFNIADPNSIGALILKIRYDDGFIASVNGVRVMDANSPENINPTFNTATSGGSSGDDNLAITLREFNISSVKGLLVAGTNTLAIQGLNSGSGSADLLVDPVLVSRQYSNPPAGTVYYTTDGSDPRASSGAVSPTALVYSSAVMVNTTTRIRARTLLADGSWSGLADNLYSFGVPSLRITELMYNPLAPPAGSPFTAQDFEFAELKNVGNSPLNLSGVKFSDGIVFSFPSMFLAPGTYGVVVKNLAAFQSRYGTTVNVIGTYTGSLDNAGENVAISDGFSQSVESFTYDDHSPWPGDADGNGPSLEIVDPLADPTNPANWRASYNTGGSPGVDGSDLTSPTVIASSFQYSSGNSITLQFSENVNTTTIKATDLTVQPTLGAAMQPNSVSFDPATKTATYTFTTLIPDGNFQATLAAHTVKDLAGNDLSFAYAFSDFALAADANRDRTVNALDFNTLASNYGQTGVSFPNGDFNYDGTVNSSDFNVLALQFGKSVAPPAAALSNLRAGPVADLFNQTGKQFEGFADLTGESGTLL